MTANPQKRRQITLDDRRLKLAKRLGKGNVSAGIRRAIDAAFPPKPDPQQPKT